MEDGVFNPVGKTDAEPSRISSVSLLCGRTEEREGDEHRVHIFLEMKQG